MFEEKDGLLKRELPLVSGKESGCATVVEIGEGESRVAIGGGHFAMIAGPCSGESESQIISLAHAVKAAVVVLGIGATIDCRIAVLVVCSVFADFVLR